MQINSQKQSLITIPVNLSKISVADFNNNVKSILKDLPKSLSLDCSQLDHVTSDHIVLLWQTLKACQNLGVDFNLKYPPLGLVRTLEALDLYDCFTSQAPTVNNGEVVYVDTFRTDSKSINEALAAFLNSIAKLRLQEAVIFELKTVFYEITTNIRQHASASEEELIVFISKIDDKKTTLIFADSCVPFNPANVAIITDFKSAAKNRQLRGLGLSMVRKMTDNMSYTRKNGTINILTIEKKWD